VEVSSDDRADSMQLERGDDAKADRAATDDEDVSSLVG